MTFGDRVDRFAVMVVLVAMALSRPLLDLLGENAEFFLVRRSPTIDIVVVGLALGIVLPLMAGLAALPDGRIGRSWFVAGSFALGVVLARLFLTSTGWADALVTSLAVLGGAGVVWAITHWQAARQMARLLLPIPLLFTALFFFFTPTGSVLAGESGLGEAGNATTPAPLVWIVLDEFPAASLMDGAGDVYGERYPNFGRLAEDAIWFPNAVTVEQQTEHSVPAILTGVKPEQDLTPFAGQYPNNIFVALSESHDLAVYESVTHLCPETLCGSPQETAPADLRAELLATDLAIVAGHTLLPHALSDTLPPIDQGWGYFGQQVEDFDAVAEFWEAYGTDPRAPLIEVVDRIEQGFDGKPPFLFVHALVPHHPWQLLPTGQRYPLTGQRTPGTTSTGWGPEEWLVTQGRQRHLINVGYADYALGRILDAMEDGGWYNDAMIVIVADHGIAVSPDVGHQRQLTEETVGEIAAVPLLIKLPEGTGGEVDPRRALTTDIVPTVAEVMGMDLPWEPDGHSLLGPDPGQVRTTTDTPAGSVTYGVDGSEVLAVAASQADTFPDPDLFLLRPAGTPDSIGEEIDLDALDDSGLRYSPIRPEWFEDLDPDADLIPVWVMGRVVGQASPGDVYGVIANGTLAALTLSYDEGGSVRVQAMIPPDSLIEGDNSIDLVRWQGDRFEAVPTIR